LIAEIAQAFLNVELALTAVGGGGWNKMYSVRSYHVSVDDEANAAMVEYLEGWCGPDHRPIWSELGESSLGPKGMRVEIKIEAFLG
jgi:enamine deaminase RidA (YjgF/YER057c/UK114 family)